MYIKNGIVYAGQPQPQVKVSGVRPLADYKLWVRFNNGEAKIFDCKELLDTPAFSPLRDEAVFRAVYIDYGVTMWQDGDIDISPEYLYEKGIPAEHAAIA